MIRAHVMAMGQVVCIVGRSHYGPKPKRSLKGRLICPRPGCGKDFGPVEKLINKGEHNGKNKKDADSKD